MVKSKLFKPEYGRELFRIAENDLEAARALAAAKTVRVETKLLMVQQALEKSVKALLCHKGQEVPQTHDLEFLIDRLSHLELTLPQVLADTDFSDLSTFATLRPYEEGRSVVSEQEVALSLELVEEILTWVRSVVFN